ncbi:hypothetical protein LEN26_013398 [Aphanomyces euteiches]|nr:hypothetical protein LEN26_013398 [Aphanomyces euteiches]
MRIALIHALRHSPPPIEAAFKRLWPQAQTFNLLDDSLASDLVVAQAAEPHASIHPALLNRFLTLGRYAASTGADGILFTCSAFGPYIEAVQEDLKPMPVLKPNEAIIHDLLALRQGSEALPVALVATFAPTLESMQVEIAEITKGYADPPLDILPVHATGALDALNHGDGDAHDAFVLSAVEKALAARSDIKIVALAQFSLERSQDVILRRFPHLTVLSTPTSAVRAIQQRLASKQ